MRPFAGPCSIRRAGAAARSLAISCLCRRIDRSTGGSSVKRSRSANATARSMRTGSSRKRSSGSPMQRIIPSFRSSQAADVVDNGEGGDVVEQRVDGEVAAEGVLLRRAEGVVAANEQIELGAPRSPAATGASATAAPSASAAVVASAAGTCRRNVATSITFWPKRTCARRKRRPMIQQLRKSRLTWYGWAEVPMSKSFGRRPSSRSRTLPPTR